MPWELIRDVGLTILFAISFARYLDLPQTNEKIRVLVDRWICSIGDRLMVAGACLALLGMAANFAQTQKTLPAKTFAPIGMPTQSTQ